MPTTIGTQTIDDVTAAEFVLDELASRVPNPTGAADVRGMIAGIFASRARDVFDGYIHSLGGSSLAAPSILARPLIELAILIRYIEDEPEQRFELWRAHSEGMDTTAIRQLEERRPRPENDPFSASAVAPVLARKDATVAAARAASGRVKDDQRVLPGLVEMADAVIKAHPEEKEALTQAYQLAFRSISPTTHSDATSLKSSMVSQPDGSVAFVPAPPVELGMLREIACASLAYTIESCARIVGDAQLEHAALVIRLRLATAAKVEP